MRLVHEMGKWIALGEAGETPLWRYVYGGKPKPFFHPVCTPAGHVLSNFEPHDHVWHRGLWFTIKFINGENFWEERLPFGTQQTVGLPALTHQDDGRIVLATRLRWVRPGGGTVIEENREIGYQALSADAYAIDLDTRLSAQTDLLLDRTPFTTWGGYGGLVMRGTRNWQKTRILLSDGTTTERPTGTRAAWADLSGVLDGGVAQSGGFAILDHPANVRHPSPWYGGAERYNNYLNAAVLFHEPMALAAGHTLRLRYRVLVHDGLWDATRLNGAWTRFASEAES